MAAIKAFFAKDIVKLIGGLILAGASGVVAIYVKDVELKTTIIAALVGIGSFLGLQSGGTSALRSDASRASLPPPAP